MNASNRMYFLSIPGAYEYLVATTSNDLAVYNVANPLAPIQLDSAHIPWDWTSINVGGSTHEPYIDHLRAIATSGGYPYGLVMMATYGWDYFHLAGTGSGFLGIGYHPANVLSNNYASAAIFNAAGSYWAAAQTLDQASIAAIGTPDTSTWASIRLYNLGTGGVPPGPATIGNGSVVVPIGHAGDSIDNTMFPLSLGNTRVYIMHVDTKTLLIARTSSVQTSAAAVVDVSDPANPLPLWSSTDPTLVGGNWAIDEQHDMLWVGDNTVAHVYGYQVATTGAMTLTQDVTYYPNAGNINFTNVSVAGNLLVATAGWKLGYVSLAGGTPTVLAAAGVPYSDLPSRTCTNTGYQESATYVTAFETGGHHYVARSLAYDQDIVAVGDGCISTVPVPDFTVTGGEAGATCQLSGGGTPDYRGFPGDAFTIEDNTAGVWTTATLDIQQGGVTIGNMGLASGTFPMTVTPGFSVLWTPPASQAPGDFTIVLSAFNPPAPPPSFKTKTLSLCGAPQAALTVAVNNLACPNPAACDALVNDTVALGDAGTSGNPSAGATYFVLAPGARTATQGATFTATDPGDYAVGVVVPYSFPAATNDPVCSAPANALLFGTVPTGTYHSCAVGAVNAGYGTASFQVEQPSGVQVAPVGSGMVLVDQPVVLRFTGRLATGYNPELNWTIPGITSFPQSWCSYTGWPTTAPVCTIPASTLQPGTPAAWNLSVDVCQSGGLGVPCNPIVQNVTAQPVTVTPTLNTFTFSVAPTNPRVGDTVTISLDTVIGNFSSLTFALGGISCTGETSITVQCNTPLGNQCLAPAVLSNNTFSYGTSELGHTETITATGTLAGGGQVTSPSVATVTVRTDPTTCPCPAVSVSASGPSSAQVGQTVQFSATASSPGYSINGYSWEFGDGGTASGNPVSHAYTRVGTFTASVTATSSCGNTGSDTSTIVVGSGGGGNLTITPSPSTVNLGQRVTFTFSPGLTTSGDRVTFNFGDGSQTQALTFLPGLCSPANPCNQITYTYTQASPAGGYTVTASGTAGGQSVSGSGQVTVVNNCTAQVAPVASFSFAPTPRVGQAVQFTDTSTGTPTAWAWTFGGPGVSGTSIRTVHTASTGNLTIEPAPATPVVGQAVIFAFSPALVQTGDRITFDFGDGTQGSSSYNASLCPPTGCNQIAHTYTAANQYAVTANGTAGGNTVSGATSVTVGGGGGGSLAITPSPTAAIVGQTVTFTFAPAASQTGDAVTIVFGDGASQAIAYPACQTNGGCNVASHAYAAANSYVVTGSGTAGGVSVTGSRTVVISAGGAGGSSTAQNPTYTFTAAGTYTVALTASNCRGSNTTSQQVTVVPLCDQTAPPTASFTWPTGPVDGFPEQQQPYAGQQITLTAASGTSVGEPTSWHWYDFNELAMNQTVTTPAFTFTWPANLPPGAKNVRMTATNCFGTSAEVVNAVTIYPDVRHVVADFTWTTGPLATGAPVTLVAAQGPSYGDPDQFTWTFDDGSPQQTGSSVTHTYTCAGTHAVRLAVGRSDYPAATASASHALTLTGTQCGPDSVMTVDAAQLSGLNNTSWLSNVRIFNPSAQTSQITVQFLPIGYNNSSPLGKTVPVGPNATLAIDNVIKWGQDNGVIGTDVKKAALRVLYSNPDSVAPILVSETYTSPTGGGTYGQLTPGIDVMPNTTPPTLWITGVRNSGTTTGFRTNYSLLNLRNTEVSNLVFTLLDPTGKAVASQSVNLGAYEYRQDSLVNLFGGAAAATSPNPLAVEVTVPDGSDIQAYTSVVDNLTGDPVLIPAVPPPAAAIFLPAVAYTPGANGTVWRSDMQLTNPDSAVHTWAVTYTPGGSGTLPIATQKTTIAAQSSVRYDDLLSWLYGGTLTDASKTSGVVEIAPDDGGSVYPIVQARSFNQTANGTFGQNIPPITPDMGVAAGQGERLLLTGLSSQDVARTNLGFVSLSDTSGVNFSVLFYDESGNVLNPKDNQGNPIPYTFALGHNGWDQDKLENRFHNAGWAALPAGLNAISAVIQVTDGGPGTAYATVIDNLTGDPNFILARAAPQAP